jgi:septal ring-binding cell division protein DamX
LQAQEARLAEQQQHLDDAINGHIKTADNLSQRLGSLDDAQLALNDSQQALKDATASLGVQQTRQASETQHLQQSLKQRSLLGMLMLLLTAAAIGFLLIRPPVEPVAPQLVMQPSASKAEAVVVPVELEAEITEMRQELSRLGSSVMRMSGSLEPLDAAGIPQLPAQVSDLEQAMQTLTQDSLRQQQENTRLTAVQDQLQAEMDKMAGEVESLQEQIGGYPAIETAAKALEGQRWATAQQLGRYTVQVLGVRKRNSLGWFIKHHGIEEETAIHRSESDGRYWYVLFHGIYETIDQAQAAVAQLPAGLAVHGPWVRRIPERGDVLPL